MTFSCFLVAVDVMSDKINLVSPVEWNVKAVRPSDMYVHVKQLLPHIGMSPRVCYFVRDCVV